MRARDETLAGWGGVPSARTGVYRPERLAEIEAVVREQPHLIARGLGRAYGDAAFDGGGATVLTERFDRILELDEQAGVLECEGGVPLDALVRVLLPRGFFPPVVPGTWHVTVAGMVACDVHGKNHHRAGAVSRNLEWIELLLADGSRTRVGPDSELFWATVGGMGLTGVIERVRMRLARAPSAWVAVDIERTPDFEATIRRFQESDDDYEFSVAWIDCVATGRQLGRSVLLRGGWLEPSQLSGRRAREPFRLRERPVPRVPLTPPSGLLNRWTVRAFNEVYYRQHPAHATGVPTDYRAFFFPLDIVDDWNRMYGPDGFHQFQCVLPEEEGVAGMRRLLETLAAAGAASFLAVLKRFGPGEPRAPLSFPRPGYTLALDLPNRGPETEELLDGLDDIVLDHGGRLYLAKDGRMKAETFRQMYPEADAWLEVKRRVDPESRFQSDLSRRLELTP